jgi:hypothetical protein
MPEEPVLLCRVQGYSRKYVQASAAQQRRLTCESRNEAKAWATVARPAGWRSIGRRQADFGEQLLEGGVAVKAGETLVNARETLIKCSLSTGSIDKVVPA